MLPGTCKGIVPRGVEGERHLAATGEEGASVIRYTIALKLGSCDGGGAEDMIRGIDAIEGDIGGPLGAAAESEHVEIFARAAEGRRGDIYGYSLRGGSGGRLAGEVIHRVIPGGWRYTKLFGRGRNGIGKCEAQLGDYALQRNGLRAVGGGGDIDREIAIERVEYFAEGERVGIGGEHRRLTATGDEVHMMLANGERQRWLREIGIGGCLVQLLLEHTIAVIQHPDIGHLLTIRCKRTGAHRLDTHRPSIGLHVERYIYGLLRLLLDSILRACSQRHQRNGREK